MTDGVGNVGYLIIGQNDPTQECTWDEAIWVDPGHLIPLEGDHFQLPELADDGRHFRKVVVGQEQGCNVREQLRHLRW